MALPPRISPCVRTVGQWSDTTRGAIMAKRGNKRRARKKSKANHGKRPNA